MTSINFYRHYTIYHTFTPQLTHLQRFKMQSGRINRLSKNIRYSRVRNSGQLRQPSVNAVARKQRKNKRPRPRRRSLCIFFFHLGAFFREGAMKRGGDIALQMYIRNIHCIRVRRGEKKKESRWQAKKVSVRDKEKERKLSVGKARVSLQNCLLKKKEKKSSHNLRHWLRGTRRLARQEGTTYRERPRYRCLFLYFVNHITWFGESVRVIFWG